MKQTYHAFFGWLTIFAISLPCVAAEVKLDSFPDSKKKQGTIHKVLKASYDEVWNTLSDVENYGEYMPKMKSVKILESDADHVLYHAIIRMPWPISNVEYDCNVFPSKDHKRIDFQMVEGTGKGVKSFYGYWEFAHVSEEEVDATYHLVFDSGRHFPEWAENLGLKSTVGNVMKNVQSRIEYLRTERTALKN